MSISTTANRSKDLTNKKDNSAIDLLKFIASIMIFTMHMNAFKDFGTASVVWECLSRWAVPFFFIVSSYFLFSKGKDGNIDKAALAGYAKRIGALYGLWLIYNLPSVLYTKIIVGGIKNVEVWADFFREAVLSSTFTGSWYLLSCVFSALFIYLLSKKLKSGTCLLVTSVLMILCVATSVYGGLIPENVSNILVKTLVFPINIFGGVFYFALGKFIVDKKEMIQKISMSRCAIFVALSFLIYAVEIAAAKHFGFYQSSDEALGLVFGAFFLVLMCLKSTMSLPHAKTLRKMSTIIYCGQGNVLVGAAFACKIVGISSSIVKFIVGCVMIAAVAAVVLAVQNSRRVSFTKYLT